MGILKERSDRWAFAVAGLTTVLCWALFVLRFHNPTSRAVLILGNIVVGVGVLLIALAMGTLRRRGAPEAGQDFAATTEVVRGGVYGVVRHPLYLGWLLTYPAAMMVSQHWLIVVLGALGVVSLVAIARGEDSELVAKFGVTYREYMAEVPRLNIVGGVMRKLRRGRQGGRAV